MAAKHDQPATKQDLDELKQELIAKIGENSLDIRANAEKIDVNGRKIDANGKKIEANGKKIDRLIRRTLENGERLDKMLTEEKFKVYFGEIMNNIDGLAKVVSRGEQEIAATNARMDRVESDVERLKAR